MSSTEPLKRLSPNIRPLRYRLHLVIDPDADGFHGTLQLDVEFGTSAQGLNIHGSGLKLNKAFWFVSNGRGENGLVTDDASGNLEISFNTQIPRGRQSFELEFSASYAMGLEGLYRVRADGKWGVYSQFEAIGARRAFPCFDEPGFKAPFEITLETPAWCAAISNGPDIQNDQSGGWRITRFATTPPLPCYLLAFVVGDFDIVSQEPVPAAVLERPPIPLRGVARRGQGANLKTALERTAPILLAIEDYFGIPYPFAKLDIVAVPDFAAGGMENAGAITYDEALVLLDEDAQFERKRDFLTTHAHEISHQWFGNLVSPKWWDDLWLNESFATFMEAKISAQIEPGWHFDTDLLRFSEQAMAIDLLSSVRRVHEPVTTEDDITAAFDAITYQKGSVALAMLEDALSETRFRSLLQRFLQENKFGHYSHESFIAAVSRLPAGNAALPAFVTMVDTTAIPEVTDKDQAFSSGTIPRYQRASLSEVEWRKAFKDIDQMPRATALSAAISLDLALQRREIGLDLFGWAVSHLAIHPEWEVAGHPLPRLDFLIAELPAPQPLRNLAAMAYAKQLGALGFREIEDEKNGDVSAWQKRTKQHELATFFASSDADPPLELDLTHFGLRLIESEQPMFDVEWLAPELVAPALTAAIRLRQAGLSERLHGKLRLLNSAWQREVVIEALSHDTAPMAETRFSALFLSEDLRKQELPLLLDARAQVPSARDSLMTFLEMHGHDLLARLGGDADIGMVRFADAFTTRAHAKRLRHMIEPWLGQLRGGKPQLELTTERIALNAEMLEALGRTKL